MEAKLQNQIAFYLTGRRSGADLEPLDGRFRPALFARFADLTSLRYDFPVILNQIGAPERSLLSLSRLVDDAVATMDDSPDRDRVARHGYRLECELRRDLTAGGSGEFAEMWRAAADRLAKADEDPESVRDSARRLLNELHAAGPVVDVSAELPAMAVLNSWNMVQQGKTTAFCRRAERLLQNLRNILNAEIAGTNPGRSPDHLKAGVGSSFAETFDFDAMSRIIAESKQGAFLSDRRRERILSLIGVLGSQRFYDTGATETYKFDFASCSDALAAYQKRRAEAVDLIRSLAVAELEVEGEYRESVHDTLFEGFGENGLDAGELAQLPDYLVCTDAESLSPDETSHLIELLAAGLPVKVLVRTDDVLQPSSVAEGHVAIGMRAQQLTDAAIGLTDVFVVQSAASQLFRMRDWLLRGLEFDGPALFSVFSGDNSHTRETPAYLVAAAAVESRVFPAFVYDPSGGSDWASRMSIGDNPHPGKDWPVHSFVYEDEELQVVSEDLAFSLADFMAMDERFFRHYAIVPVDDWHDALVAIPEALDHEFASLPDRVPFVPLVDGDGQLYRAILDDRTLSAVRRCRTMWNGLQELGGLKNLRQEMKIESEIGTQTKPESTPATSTEELESGPIIEAEPTAKASLNGDDPYIETERCTTCNECTQINDKMFSYDENKQAFIADPDAGTFRQLVEAAEGCQVSIIHPGKPRNPKEPGLEDLIKRAAEFN